MFHAGFLGRFGGAPIPPASLPASVELVRDLSSFDWVRERVRPWSKHAASVGNIVPEGYPAYARILHTMEQAGNDKTLRWSEVAEATGRVAHPLMQLGLLVGNDYYDSPDWLDQPSWGSLPGHETRTLVDILREFTEGDRCYFAYWYGRYPVTPQFKGEPVLRLPARDYIIFSGPLDAIIEFSDSWSPWRTPQLWWSTNGVWFVGTDIDHIDTYVGASEACIRSILNCADLESFASSVDARVDFGSDTINAR